MANFSFNCPFCNIELEIDESGAGQEIECPGCNEVLIIPAPAGGYGDEGGGGIPSSDDIANAAIIKPKGRTLEVAAKIVKKLTLKTFRHHEHVKDGSDTFDADVSQFLSGLMEDDIISIRPIQYTHMEKIGEDAKEIPVNQYGIAVLFKT